MKHTSLEEKLDAKLKQHQNRKIAEKLFSEAISAEETRAFQEENDYLPPVLFG